jgi:hypothetical protein
MTATGTVTTGTPVASWLLPPSNQARIQLERVVQQASADQQQAGPLRTLGAVARRALVEEIEAKLRMVMSDTIGDLVIGGWRAHAAIKQAIRKSRNEPGVDQVVSLRSHTITADQRHDLDVEIDGIPVMTLSARLIVSLQLHDAVAVVRDGYLVAVRSGQAGVTGSVTAEGVEIAQRTLTFPLTVELALHRPRDLSP